MVTQVLVIKIIHALNITTELFKIYLTKIKFRIKVAFMGG